MKHDSPEIFSICFGIIQTEPRTVHSIGSKLGGLEGGYITSIVCDIDSFDDLGYYEYHIYASKVKGDKDNQYLARIVNKKPDAIDFYNPNTEHNTQFA